MSPRAFVALVGSGFRRWSSYKQATFAAAFTNSAFGFLKCYVLLAVVHAQHRVGGYDAEQLVTYVWLGQGLLGVVTLWGWTELSDRVKSGDVAIDLLRPTDPLPAYYAADLGRAGHAALTRLIIPLCVGAVAFGLYVPHRPQTVGVLLVSIVAAVSISFAVRYLVNLTAFWVLDARGFIAAWMVCGNIATGLMVPLWFFPDVVRWLLWCTPFPYMLQVPLDIAVERTSATAQLWLVAAQCGVAALAMGLCVWAQRAGARKLVIQGG